MISRIRSTVHKIGLHDVNHPTENPALVLPASPPVSSTGLEWIVDASQCDPMTLQSVETLKSLCESVISDLGLQVVGEPQCHKFPGAGGVTCLFLLSESHLACHTYPEFGFATFNLYCCRDRDSWPWESRLCELLDSQSVTVRTVRRGPSALSTDSHQSGDLP